MDKYIYAECPPDDWPVIKSLQARSYNEAVEHLITYYFDRYDDNKILNLDTFEELKEYLNNEYILALSDLVILEEL